MWYQLRCWKKQKKDKASRRKGKKGSINEHLMLQNFFGFPLYDLHDTFLLTKIILSSSLHICMSSWLKNQSVYGCLLVLHFCLILEVVFYLISCLHHPLSLVRSFYGSLLWLLLMLLLLLLLLKLVMVMVVKWVRGWVVWAMMVALVLVVDFTWICM